MMLATIPFPIFQHALMNVGNDGVCNCNIATNVRNGYVRVHRKFGLEEGPVNDDQAEKTQLTLKT